MFNVPGVKGYCFKFKPYLGLWQNKLKLIHNVGLFPCCCFNHLVCFFKYPLSANRSLVLFPGEQNPLNM